jgi:GNAT superfamily N-acetyltransferase
MPDVVLLDPRDDAALGRWHAVRTTSARHGRPFALTGSLAALTASVQHPDPTGRRLLLAAVEGAVVVGVAELGLPLAETHLAELQVDVAPEHRRRGVGSALHAEADWLRREAGRSTVIGEVTVPAGDDPAASAGTSYAAAMGFAVVHTEEHLVMRLPGDPFTVAALTREVPGYEVVTWQGRCPDELRPAYVAMRNQMNADVPTGGRDRAPVQLDDERLAASEERLARSYDTVVAAVRRVADGAMGGYSSVHLDHSDDVAVQDDTLVVPEHRGRGLGMQLKLATLGVLGRDHPGRRFLHTRTDPDDGAMYRTNVAFGFASVETVHEVQRVD